jgi:hypothetical protein
MRRLKLAFRVCEIGMGLRGGLKHRFYLTDL